MWGGGGGGGTTHAATVVGQPNNNNNNKIKSKRHLSVLAYYMLISLLADFQQWS